MKIFDLLLPTFISGRIGFSIRCTRAQSNATVAILCLFLLTAAPKLALGQIGGELGGQIYSSGGDVTVTILPSDAGYTSDIYALLDGNLQFIGTNHEPGTAIDLGQVSAGIELEFFILVENTGNQFYTGPGSRNPDGVPHAIVATSTAPSTGVTTLVSFEDTTATKGGDFDYNDVIIQVVNKPCSVELFLTPESVVGGASVNALVGLGGCAAPPGGAMITLYAPTLWPSVVENPNVVGNVATIMPPNPVTLQEGDFSVGFGITTSGAPLWPIYVKAIACYNSLTDDQDLIVAAPTIPDFGPAADARVTSILILIGPHTHTDLLNIELAFNRASNLRNQCSPQNVMTDCGPVSAAPDDGGYAAEQDIYLAAAEHYLFALYRTRQVPIIDFLVPYGIPFYDLLKGFKIVPGLGSCNPPLKPSRHTDLSIQWGEKGARDAISINRGDLTSLPW